MPPSHGFKMCSLELTVDKGSADFVERASQMNQCQLNKGTNPTDVLKMLLHRMQTKRPQPGIIHTLLDSEISLLDSRFILLDSEIRLLD